MQRLHTNYTKKSLHSIVCEHPPTTSITWAGLQRNSSFQLVIIITGAWSSPDAAFVAAREAGQGGALTSLAMSSVIPTFKYILSAAVVLFAFSTMISWSYYGERCWAWLFGDNSSLVYRLLFLFFAFLGSIVTAGNVLDFSDLMILGMAFPNILGVLLLSGKVRGMLDDYQSKLASGEIKKTQ